MIIDTLGAAPFTVRAFAYCTWPEVLPMYIAAAIAVPIGTLALLVIDPIVLRWFIAFLVLSLVGVLMSGWRYHGRPRLPITAAVGLFSGFGSGAVQIAGPPVLIYWLGTANNVITVRANFLVYFLLLGLTSCAVYFWKGLFTPELLALALLLAIPFFLATAIGAKYFHGASDQAVPPHRLRHHRARGTGQPAAVRHLAALEHDPEKWNPVFGKDHAQNKNQDYDPIQLNWIIVLSAHS